MELWKHQQEAINKAALLPGYALFFEMGTGKTRSVIEIYRAKCNLAGRVLRAIVFTPPIVISNFKSEFHKFSKLKDKDVVALKGPAKIRLAKFIAQMNNPNGAKVFITNYEALSMPALFAAFQKFCPEVLVFDESHKCKNPTAARSQLADTLSNPVRGYPKPLTYLLSGTPVLNTPLDIFQQFLILDNGESFGKNYWSFRARYFADRNAGMPKQSYYPNWQIMTIEKDDFDAERDINEKLWAKGMRVEKKDCLDLPPEISITLPVEMTSVQVELYKKLKNDLIAFYNGGVCATPLAITKALRLMQITSGFLSTETPGENDGGPTLHSMPDTPKIKALEDLLETITGSGHKVLVWAVWRENYKHIKNLCDKMRIRYVEVHGDISEKRKEENVQAFKENPDIKVFIGHPGSGGIGINLVEAAYSIFYSRNFSLEQHLQARARNHRGGAKEAGHKSITHYDLVCSGTIDEICNNKLVQKNEMSESLLKEIIEEEING